MKTTRCAGPDGVRDLGRLESAISRARQKFTYATHEIDIPALAAAYPFGIAGQSLGQQRQ